MTTHTTLHEGALAATQEKTYVHLPFDVPDGATRLDVAFEYSDRIGSDPRLSGGNTIDLGVFDERGIGFLDAGFRGWSGSERSSFTITESEATPGYLAGPLRPGRWHVLLGLYKIAAQGCRYRLTVRVTAGAKPARSAVSDALPLAGRLPARTARPSSPIRPRYAPWLRGELHCHTEHSDGRLSPRALVRLAHELGLDFLAVTDHNTTSGQQALARLTDPGLLLVRGLEVTTFAGHFNFWGSSEWVDFRVRTPDDMAAALRAARAAGGTTACNHPKPYGPPWNYPAVDGYDVLEVWNGPWETLNRAALDFWTAALDRGRRLPVVGGSDFHRHDDRPPRAPGSPTTWVYVPGPVDEAALLRAIRAGHASLSATPEGPFLDLRAGPPGEAGEAMGGDLLPPGAAGAARPLPVRVYVRGGAGLRLRLLDQAGERFACRVAGDDELVSVSLPVAASLYVRADLWDLTNDTQSSDGSGGGSPAPGRAAEGPNAQGSLRALTNPIYLGRSAQPG